ncbi:carbonic anhydrase [Desulfosalsimonas propionicica]|uniref:Carbonic anhydrase n=1 Tax=Desulfosalsimonas propionicica TaxID=332175 RepID=A0A7W0C929_9BACT|nr:carbonate dehydratase [Desulfosalsimonas propionicica]MBA2881416.1 carbonic anhydrase [Desulfosalsimonas propionicica]
MKNFDTLFENNRKWAETITSRDPDFFTRLSRQQKPGYLWIGCSDSRVPASRITDMMPGEIFVHRNIANLVVHSDLSCLSVIQYAVEALEIGHIIVCGHYGCGGVQAALENKDHGLIDNWLGHIRDVYRRHKAEIDTISDPKAKVNRLCEFNVRAQVINVCETTIVQNAWKSGRELAIHGLIYSLEDGLLKDLNPGISGLDQYRALLP